MSETYFIDDEHTSPLTHSTHHNYDHTTSQSRDTAAAAAAAASLSHRSFSVCLFELLNRLGIVQVPRAFAETAALAVIQPAQTEEAEAEAAAVVKQQDSLYDTTYKSYHAQSLSSHKHRPHLNPPNNDALQDTPIQSTLEQEEE